jgi:hypothetical protein
MPETEQRKIVYVDKETGGERSRWQVSLDKAARGNTIFYKTSSSGKGDYDTYKDASWEAGSELEERKGLLYPMRSFIFIKDPAGRIIARRERQFDYDKRKIFYSESDSNGNIIDKAVFPIKGLTADSATLIYILRAFVAHHEDKAYGDFYLLSDKKKLYHVIVKPIGRETLDLPSGKVGSIKLRLVPDMGPLTGIMGSLIPPTFVWHADKPPYEWLQYEGLETGIGSTLIRSYLFKKK